MENLKADSTFVITYEDGTNSIVKPVSWKKLEDVEILQYEILKAAYGVNFSLSALFKPSNKQFWTNAKKLAKLLPVVGQEKPGFNPELIDSMDELCRIFISTSPGRMHMTGSVWGEDNALQPSEISRIHHLNFIQLLIRLEELDQEEAKNTTTKTATQEKKDS